MEVVEPEVNQLNADVFGESLKKGRQGVLISRASRLKVWNHAVGENEANLKHANVSWAQKWL